MFFASTRSRMGRSLYLEQFRGAIFGIWAAGRRGTTRSLMGVMMPPQAMNKLVTDAATDSEAFMVDIALTKAKKNDRIGVGLSKDSLQGLLVVSMAKDGLAMQNLRLGDRLLSVNGVPCSLEAQVNVNRPGVSPQASHCPMRELTPPKSCSPSGLEFGPGLETTPVRRMQANRMLRESSELRLSVLRTSDGTDSPTSRSRSSDEEDAWDARDQTLCA